MSVWTGANSDAWFDENMLMKARTLISCERKPAKNIGDGWYQIGVDVGRYRCNTVIVVCKVLPRQGGYKKHIVYIEVINGENFITEQAPRIKELIKIYKPREVVMDGNGIGAGLLDAMAIPSTNLQTGENYPAYYVFNNEGHLPPNKKNVSETPLPAVNAIIYDMKANASNDSLIHGNIYAQFSNGAVALLTNERIARQKLMKTEKGRKMGPYESRKFLLPYEMTSRLVDEILNLRLKVNSQLSSQTKVEQINTSIAKDRFSALEYVLWRVKFYEDNATRRANRKNNFKDLHMFTSKRK